MIHQFIHWTKVHIYLLSLLASSELSDTFVVGSNWFLASRWYWSYEARLRVTLLLFFWAEDTVGVWSFSFLSCCDLLPVITASTVGKRGELELLLVIFRGRGTGPKGGFDEDEEDASKLGFLLPNKSSMSLAVKLK